jgi:RNA polymerase sigma-70 factor (ECF subfamily)
MSEPGEAEPPDAALVAAAREGQVRALERLLERHEARVLRLLRFLGVPDQDREDVAQEIFIRVFRHLQGFRPGQEFGAWVWRVTVNAAHDYRGRRRRQEREEAAWIEGTERQDPRPGPVEEAREAELRRDLERALATLTERERAVFVLREIEGLDSGRVARVLGITGITVRRHLSRARRHLRAALGERSEKKTIAVEQILPGGSSQG